jgi:hypothetical protein
MHQKLSKYGIYSGVMHHTCITHRYVKQLGDVIAMCAHATALGLRGLIIAKHPTKKKKN